MALWWRGLSEPRVLGEKLLILLSTRLLFSSSLSSNASITKNLRNYAFKNIMVYKKMIFREYKPEEEARDVKNSTPFASSWEKEVILYNNVLSI
jgi:hypothetical protein